MRTKAKTWLRGLTAAFIAGFSTSFLTALGVSGAEAVGVQIEKLSLGQLTVVTFFGGLIGMAAYLKQSPLPPPED